MQSYNGGSKTFRLIFFMRHIRFIIFLLIGLFYTGTHALFADDSGQAWLPVIFLHDGYAGPVEGQLKRYAAKELPRLEKFYAYRFTDTITVYLFSSRDYRKIQSDYHIPDWGIAVALPEKNLIFMNTVSAQNTGLIPNINAVFIHELSHLFLAKKAAPFARSVPVWFNEGCAVWISGERRSLEMLNKALLTGSLIAFDDIEYVLRYDPFLAELAYDQSYSAVQSLIGEYGDSVIAGILSKTAETGNFHQAFRSVTGQTVYQFEKDWESALKPPTVIQWAQYTEAILWILIMPALFIIAWIIKRLRAKKKIREWVKDEETAESIGTEQTLDG